MKYKIKSTEHYYNINGDIPEFKKETTLRLREIDPPERKLSDKRKSVKCPHCNKRLTDTNEDARIELFNQPTHVHIECQFYIKCTGCKKEIGINLV